MIIPEHTMVVLTRDVPEEGLRAGQAGAVVGVYGNGGYEVEFVDAAGDTIAVVTLGENDIRAIPEELTDTERDRWRATHAAGDEFRAAMDSGGEQDRKAAFRQFFQALKQLDPGSTRDKVHVPDDAGEYADALRRILCRIPDGWGRWISCDAGWYPIIVELDAALAEIDPGYELHQVKEKFGGLRYYFGVAAGISDEQRKRMNALVDEAENRCETTCERCGEPGALYVNARSWLKTMCAACAAVKGGYGLVGETVDQLAPDNIGRWQITTAGGGQVVIDLTYVQYHGGGEPQTITDIPVWPKVGERFRLRVGSGADVEPDTAIVEIKRI